MPEVSPASAPNSAARTVQSPERFYSKKTAFLGDFRSLLKGSGSRPNPAVRPIALPGPSIVSQTAAEGGQSQAHGHGRRRAPADPDPDAGPTPESPLDPLSCQLAWCHGPAIPRSITPLVASASAPAPTVLPEAAELQQLLSGLARRVAWGGDRRKGSARIELSEGTLAGATLVVHTEQRSVSVELELPSGTRAQGWEARLTQRLEARGFSARVRVG